MRREFPGEFAAEEPRALLRLTKAAAESEFWTGWALHDEFPEVMEAFRAGRLDWPRARLFPEVLLNLTPAQICVITSRVLIDAPDLTTGQLRARLQREAMAIDAAWWSRRYREQVRGRRVEKRVNGDGTADLQGRDLPLDEVGQSMANLTRLAKAAKKAGDPRPIDTIRADLFTGYLNGSYQQVDDSDIITDLLRRAAAETNDSPDRDSPGGGFDRGGSSGDGESAVAEHEGGRASRGLIGEDDVVPAQRPEPSDAVPDDLEPRHGRVRLPRRPMAGGRPGAGLEIRVELGTLLGLDDHPGEIAGYGPVAAEMVRKLVARQARGHWRYALCDRRGHLIDSGVIFARPAGWLDFAAPITGATVEIAFTEAGLQAAHAATTVKSRPAVGDASTTQVPAPARSAAQAAATDGGAGAGAGVFGASVWRPVLVALTRGVGLGGCVGVVANGDDPGRRLPGAGLRRRVQVRFRGCVAPGCRKPAAECEIDHREAYGEGGATVAENLEPLCKWHHRMKHVAGWKLAALDEHRFRWTTPNGNHIDVHPEPIIADLPEPTLRK